MKIKKEISLFSLIVLILFLFPLVSCLDISLSKSEYSPRETLQAEITGNFYSLTSDDVQIYQENKAHSEPLIQGLTKQEGIYYFYAVLPNQEGKFSLKIENAEYIESGNVKTSPIIRNFTIKKSNQSTLSINPGFVFTNKDFSIKVKALNTYQNINIYFENYTKNISLIEESEQIIPFSIAGIATKKTTLSVGNYNIPVFIIQKISTNPAEQISRIGFGNKNITATISPGNYYLFNVFIGNIGEKNITGINISNNFNANVNPNYINSLYKEENKQLNISILIPNNQKNNISGEITVNYNNQSVILPVFLFVTENKTLVTVTGKNISDSLSCSNIGMMCTESQDCNGQITPSLEGACCIGTCEDKKKPNNIRWIVGVILLIFLIGLGVLIYIQAKRKQKPKSLDDVLKEKTKKLREEMAGEDIKEIE